MSKHTNTDLNPQQLKAMHQIEGPSVILAGAGSGKTRVLIQKVKHLIADHHVLPGNIIMITFTNKAAREMRERMGDIILGYIGTFHTLCAKMLRIDGPAIDLPSSYVIYDDEDSLNLIKSIVKKKTTRFSPGYFMHRISAAKNEMIAPDKYLAVFSDYNAQITHEIYEEYQKELKNNNAVDFDDLLLKTIELLMARPEILAKYQRRYQHILVDEFQDTNIAQYTLTRLLAGGTRNITIVGDFSQSIYSWRGADIRNLEKFQKDFPDAKVYKLERNYRSTNHILNFAYEVISKNTLHPILHLHTLSPNGEEVDFYEAHDEQDEAFYILSEIEKMQDRCKSFAILYRTNAQSRVLEEAFLHSGISYVLVGGTRFYERKEIKDVLSYLRLLVNPNDKLALERIRKLGKRRFEDFRKVYKEVSDPTAFTTSELMEKVFNKTGYLTLYDENNAEDYSRLENLKELKSVALSFPNIHEFLEQVALVESEYSEDEKKKNNNKDGAKLMTLHQAKGLEFDCVFIVGLEEGLLPHAKSLDDQFSMEEERRLFYVGITRARKKLYITHARRRFIFGRRGEAMKSRFIEDDSSSRY